MLIVNFLREQIIKGLLVVNKVRLINLFHKELVNKEVFKKLRKVHRKHHKLKISRIVLIIKELNRQIQNKVFSKKLKIKMVQIPQVVIIALYQIELGIKVVNPITKVHQIVIIAL